LDTLEDFCTSSSSADVKARANGLHGRFVDGNTLLCLHIAVAVFEPLKNLCTALQGPHVTVSGMMTAVDYTVRQLMTPRDDNSFDSLYRSAEEQVTQMKLDAIHLVRQSRPSRRLNQGGAAAAAHTVFNTPASYFKPAYLMAIDTAVQGLRARFDQDSFATVKGLEECLLTGSVISVVRTYPEIDWERLAIQLPMFRSSFEYNSVDQATTHIQSSSSEVKQLFSEVVKLIRCLLVLPASCCEAERCFSSLRRLKS
jgi:hypothetical protein